MSPCSFSACSQVHRKRPCSNLIKNVTKSNLGEERFHLAYTSAPQSITEESQARTQVRLKAKTMDERCLLASSLVSSCISSFQTICLGLVLTAVGEALL